MRTNRERARLVHERTAALRREMRARRRRRLNAVCMAACLLLVTGIGALMPMLMENVSSGGVSHASGTASLIAENGALGCILVGLFAFLLGVCVTVLLYHETRGGRHSGRFLPVRILPAFGKVLA